MKAYLSKIWDTLVVKSFEHAESIRNDTKTLTWFTVHVNSHMHSLINTTITITSFHNAVSDLSIYHTSAAIWLCQMAMNKRVEYLDSMRRQDVGRKVNRMLHKFRPWLEKFIKCLKINRFIRVFLLRAHHIITFHKVQYSVTHKSIKTSIYIILL